MKKLELNLKAKSILEHNTELFNEYIDFSDSGADLIVGFTELSEKPVIQVKKNDNEIIISCPKKYFFRALGIAIKNKHKTSYSVIEKPKFKNLTFLLDCSRNGVISFDAFKILTLRLSLIGYTSFQLYMEDTLELEGEP